MDPRPLGILEGGVNVVSLLVQENPEGKPVRGALAVDLGDVGIVAAGIDTARVSSRGFGEKNPIATNDTAEGRAKNRRIEIKILKR